MLFVRDRLYIEKDHSWVTLEFVLGWFGLVN
jgi:hypothetical protein